MATLRGVIFDLDGVITGTARVHSLAWESMFNWYLKKVADRDGTPYSPFTPEDYLTYVDGKPRMQGVKSFLESRSIDLPFGDLEDGPDAETVCGLGNRKNADFQKVLKREGPDVYATSVAFVEALKAKGVRVAVASSSRNCQLILKLAKLDKLFEARVDGVVSHKRGLSGKPDPDIFVSAAADLGLEPADCVVVEDAISGVAAGRAGNFGLTLGIAREQPGDVLLASGADLVVTDLGEIDLADLEEWFGKGMERDGWLLRYHSFDGTREKLRETLTTVGNGYMATRGASCLFKAGEEHYPGTYVAGVYNKIPTEIHGRDIYNNDLVNCPNWLLVEFRINKGAFQDPAKLELLAHNQGLDMRSGTAWRAMVVRDLLGRMTAIRTEMLVSMADPHAAALSFSLTPVNWEGELTLRSLMDGDIINDNVPRYRQLNQHHLEPVASGSKKDLVYLHVQTTASRYQVVMAAKHRLRSKGKDCEARAAAIKEPGLAGMEYALQAEVGQAVRLEKLVSVHTSLDQDLSPKGKKGGKASGKAVLKAALDGLDKLHSYKKLKNPHAKAWEKLWDKADIRIEGDRFVQRTARLHAFHLLVTASPHNTDIDAGMPARGLHGEAYRGHVFWDELYIMPFFDLKFPDISKALLLYRYNRLDGAREYAKESGYQGAMYPWQTCDGGDEETQELHYNPKSGDWGPDLSRRQRHVSIAVFFNVWRYVRDTGDTAFLKKYGAEMMLEIARFWASISKKGKDKRFHISGVMGPDEFHEALPGSKEPGITDNAYTNVMVSWLLDRARELESSLGPKAYQALAKKIGLKPGETSKWEDIAHNLHVSMQGDVMEQYQGYFGLDELDWDAYREKYGDIHRMDRILKAEGDSPDHYKVAKQADTLMAFYVLPPGEVKEILHRLGVEVGDETTFLRANYDYYEPRTSHGSTLSKVVHAVISSYFPESGVWDWFMEAMVSDVEDTQGGTTPEGIHTGVMAGSLDIIRRYFAGVDVGGGRLSIDPHLPEHWRSMGLKILHRGVWYDLALDHEAVTITVQGKGDKAHTLTVRGKEVKVKPGRARRVPLT